MTLKGEKGARELAEKAYTIEKYKQAYNVVRHPIRDPLF